MPVMLSVMPQMRRQLINQAISVRDRPVVVMLLALVALAVDSWGSTELSWKWVILLLIISVSSAFIVRNARRLIPCPNCREDIAPYVRYPFRLPDAFRYCPRCGADFNISSYESS